MANELTTRTPESLAQFLSATQQRDDLHDPFTLENPYLLELNLSNQLVYAKAGSMIAFLGELQFRREGILERGLLALLKSFITSEGAALMKVSGRGRAYLADKSRRIKLLKLAGESITINGNDLLAFDSSLAFDVRMMRRLGSMLAGGLFNVHLSGSGHVAICTHGAPMTLVVSPGQPVYTDPQATVAWSSSLEPDLSGRFEMGALWGRSSGESFRMKFEGSGWVMIQPHEEKPIVAKR